MSSLLDTDGYSPLVIGIETNSDNGFLHKLMRTKYQQLFIVCTKKKKFVVLNLGLYVFYVYY